ncbi:hypothetical protein OU994_18195 [Pseudoduganella sp. SL102]|uniref:hypothetical protein n=1 Tax=Pseudoduganella sp. SL102 TaxID=2995154 RepID=UPI00248C33B2|nr:hypothetical protein [Pseudoduganella sp. SL102]WBS00253.1 hypothetical protein OU994_18195 [Pseudoduganella sp. SL102]
MFELLKQTVKLSNLNPRAEKHGDDTKPALDLKIEATCPSTILAYFHPELRQHLYKFDDNPDLVDQVSDGGDGLTVLRYPKMGAIKWDWEGAGYKAEVDYGLGGASNIVLDDVKVDHFAIEAMNGGSVTVTFRVIAHPNADDVGKLCEFIQREIVLDLVPPAPTTVGDLFKAAA